MSAEAGREALRFYESRINKRKYKVGELSLDQFLEDVARAREEHWTDDEIIKYDVAKALHGDKECAKEVLGWFATSALLGKYIHPAIMCYVGIAIDRIISCGEKPEKALGISGSKGRDKLGLEGFKRDFKFFYQVYELRRAGITFEDAVVQVANENNVSESTVKRAFTYFKPVFVPPNAPTR